MSTIADIFAVGQELSGPPGADGAPGKTFTVNKLTLVQQGQFQRWLETRAHQAVDRSDASQEEKDRRHHMIDVDAGLGKYEYDGEYALHALWTLQGLAKFVSLSCKDQGISGEEADALVKYNVKRLAAIAIAKQADDPKAIAPVLGALGFPTDWLSVPPSEPLSNNSSTPPSTEPTTNSETSPTTSSSSSTPSNADSTGT